MTEMTLGKTATEEEKKERPTLSGDVQMVTVQPDGTKLYEKVGSIGLWPNKEKKGNQPDFYGQITPPQDMPGPTYNVSLWDRTKEASK